LLVEPSINFVPGEVVRVACLTPEGTWSVTVDEYIEALNVNVEAMILIWFDGVVILL
jgi:hypothetical protein